MTGDGYHNYVYLAHLATFLATCGHFGHSGQSVTSENGPNWFPLPENLGVDTRIKSPNQIYSGGGWRTPLSGPLFWPQMANFGHPGESGASENGPNGFPISQNLGMDTRIKSLALSKPKLHFVAILGVLEAKFVPPCFFLIFLVSKPIFLAHFWLCAVDGI